jgi:hypothetical protein
MSTTSNYKFNNVDRIEDDSTTLTQRTLQNDRYSNYATMNYFSNIANDEPIRFATSQPAIIPVGVMGSGVGGNNVDGESLLLLKTDQERALGRLNLMERQFLTVPYLGRGGGDPTLESQLQQGQMIRDMKSVATISEKPYIDYQTYPIRDDLRLQITNPAYSVEELAMNGWTRGGASARENGVR